jgi:hypothetical protein
MNSQKVQQLQQLLGSLPPQMAARLAKAVEIDRLNDGRMLPHEAILEGLRPILRNQHAERAVTPLRLFCRPFEDLLTVLPRKTKQVGRIERSSIMLVWNWVSQTLIRDAAAEYSIGVKTAVLAGNADEAIHRAEQFWTVASQAILSALDNDRGRKAARAVLGGDAGVADAREMALLLSVGKDVLDIQGKLHRPVPSLNNDHVWKLREIYDRLAAATPEAAPYVAVITMHRLERPWEALKLPMNVTRQTQDTLMSSTDMGLVGELLLGELDHYISSIRAVRPAQFDADQLISDVVGFTTLSTGIVKAIEIRRDGKWGQRILSDRAAIAEVMNGFMERAPKEVLAALPTIKSGSYAGGPRMPDLSRPAEPEKSDRALAFVRLIGGCRAFAPAASFGASNKDAIDEVTSVLTSYTEDLLKELRSATGDKRAHAEQYFNLVVEMTALLFSREEADMLRRRGRAAMPAEAA